MSRLIKLLLVNSHAEHRESIAKLVLETEVFQLVEVQTGEQAINVLREQRIECIITDIDIDGFDGWRLARMVRAGIFQCDAQVPIIIIASTWCEHIAETTAREFTVNRLLSFEEKHKLPSILADALSSKIEHSSKVPLLVIEDNEEIQEIVSRILGNRFEIELASNGEDGFKLWLEKRHQIVLLDVMLPGISGEEVLTKILNESASQAVIIMTAHGTMEMAEKLIIQGAADFITKPFRAEPLRRVCEIASRREDFMISNKQFADKVKSLREKELEYKKISEAHQQLLDSMTTAVLELNELGKIHFYNKAWAELTGYTESEIENKDFLHFICPEFEQEHNLVEDTIKDLFNNTISQCTLEFKIKHKKNLDIWMEARLSAAKQNDGSTFITLTLDDITKRKTIETKLEHLALHDTLTNLHNRYYFDTELSRLTHLSNRGEGPHALLYIDLDHFKIINDSQGHHQGDIVLKEVSKTIKSRLRKSDLLCRIGGDEFAVLVTFTSLTQAKELADEICEVVKLGHYQFDGQVYKLSCSIGVTSINGEAESAHEYLKQSDIALYVAKHKGRDLVHIYSDTDKDSEKLRDTIEWIHELQQAIANDNIVLHFQPVMKIKDYSFAYFEALVRLNINGELVYPNSFIPALERAEDIKLLDHQVVAKSISMLAEYPDLKRIAINLSAHAFSDEKLSPLISQKIQQYQVDPKRIIFELTESASLTNLSATMRMIKELNQLGCGFSIDDFGTGFSTFSYLKQLPAKSVKIDGSFVQDMKSDPIDVALVRAIKDIAQSLGKVSVAEFVEDRETLEMLAEIGVDYAQGYYIAKPQPIETALKLKCLPKPKT
ncbi:EAL domain-containing protein [Catenovulum maritimum]|uniref:Diguanylate cyclase n=1 Tax=Catenovulum maritimum TaxID=1513271 RepID=A0A0J8GSN5_9ALTE|nr:EAL domain-containing protein [Catenovulum maritimum]KMT65757.1 diguanylate cyclase [Catenovulum maritimum]